LVLIRRQQVLFELRFWVCLCQKPRFIQQGTCTVKHEKMWYFSDSHRCGLGFRFPNNAKRRRQPAFPLVVAAMATIFMVGEYAATITAPSNNGPDLNVVKREAAQPTVEQPLSSPMNLQQSTTAQNAAIYDVEPPKKRNSAWAVDHGTLNVFTIGLWDVVGSQLEVANAPRVLAKAGHSRTGNMIALTSKR
jgi:hypothetical protein